MSEATKFWMVWSPSGKGPTYRHDNRQSATTEAKRLARACPNQEFFVLKALGGLVAKPIIPDEPEAIQMIDDPIPF